MGSYTMQWPASRSCCISSIHTLQWFCVYACVGGGSWIPFNGVRLLIASRQLFRYKGRVCPHRTYTLAAFSLSYTMQCQHLGVVTFAPTDTAVIVCVCMCWGWFLDPLQRSPVADCLAATFSLQR